MRWITSRTTIPGSTSTWYSTNWPPLASPRHTRNRRSDTSCLQILDFCLRDLGQFGRRRRPLDLDGLHAAMLGLADDHVVLAPLLALARVVVARVRAPALLTHQGRARDCFGGDEQRAQIERLVPARVVLRGAVRLDLGGIGVEPPQLHQRLLQIRLHPYD